MAKLRDSSEIKEAAELFGQLLESNRAQDAQRILKRGERLEGSLRIMCERAGFSGAAVADDDGLMLASFGVTIDNDVLSALAIVTDESLSRIAHLFRREDINHSSVDINFQDKIVTRRFDVDDSPYFLLVVCPQETDERSEVELSIDQITSIVSER